MRINEKGLTKLKEVLAKKTYVVVAAESGLVINTLQNVLKSKPVNGNTLKKLAKYLQVNPTSIVDI